MSTAILSSLAHRHPRYTFFTLFLLLTTFLFLVSQRSPTPLYIYEVDADNDALQAKLQVAERIYQKTLSARKGLIAKYGPSPKDIMMFPPDEEPWPPYTVWDYFPASFNCPHEVERVGAMGDGGKWVCGLSRLVAKPDCVVYSIGVSYESSFEAAVLSRTSHCQVYGYDASAHSFGPEISLQDRHRAHFYPVGVSSSLSENGKAYPLEALMRKNGHEFIDILKIDVESREFDLMRGLLKSWYGSTVSSHHDENDHHTDRRPLPFGQLLIELHAWDDNGNRRFVDILAWFEMLEEAGLRPFRSEANLVYANYNHQGGPELSEYSFLNTRGGNVFVESEKGRVRFRVGGGIKGGGGGGYEEGREKGKSEWA